MKHPADASPAAPAAPAFLATTAAATRALSLQVESVRDESRFYSLKDEWNALARETAPHNVFLRHEWFDAAWQWRRTDSRLRLLYVLEDGKPVGLAPFVLTRRRRRGIPVRILQFLTIPDTQSCDILATPDKHGAVMNAIVDSLHATRDQWDVLALSHLREGCPTVDALRARLPRSASVTDINLYIDLSGGWQAFYAQRSRRLKKANNLVANRLQRAIENIDLEWIRADSTPRESVERAVDTVTQLSARSWKKTTGLSLDQPGPGAFFRRLVEHAHANSWLSLWVLRLDRTAAAMEFQLIYEGQVHALRADFDESMKPLSPGSYLNWKLIESLFDKPLQRYWLGPGENRYKFHWTEAHERLQTVTVYGASWRGRWLALLELVVRPRIKKWLGRDSVSPSPPPGRSDP